MLFRSINYLENREKNFPPCECSRESLLMKHRSVRAAFSWRLERTINESYRPCDIKIRLRTYIFTKQFSQLMNFRAGPRRLGYIPDAYPKDFSHSEDSCRNELHPHVFPASYPWTLSRLVPLSDGDFFVKTIYALRDNAGFLYRPVQFPRERALTDPREKEGGGGLTKFEKRALRRA